MSSHTYKFQQEQLSSDSVRVTWEPIAEYLFVIELYQDCELVQKHTTETPEITLEMLSLNTPYHLEVHAYRGDRVLKTESTLILLKSPSTAVADLSALLVTETSINLATAPLIQGVPAIPSVETVFGTNPSIDYTVKANFLTREFQLAKGLDGLVDVDFEELFAGMVEEDLTAFGFIGDGLILPRFRVNSGYPNPKRGLFIITGQFAVGNAILYSGGESLLFSTTPEVQTVSIGYLDSGFNTHVQLGVGIIEEVTYITDPIEARNYFETLDAGLNSKALNDRDILDDAMNKEWAA